MVIFYSSSASNKYQQLWCLVETFSIKEQFDNAFSRCFGGRMAFLELVEKNSEKASINLKVPPQREKNSE